MVGVNGKNIYPRINYGSVCRSHREKFKISPDGKVQNIAEVRDDTLYFTNIHQHSSFYLTLFRGSVTLTVHYPPSRVSSQQRHSAHSQRNFQTPHKESQQGMLTSSLNTFNIYFVIGEHIANPDSRLQWVNALLLFPTINRVRPLTRRLDVIVLPPNPQGRQV